MRNRNDYPQRSTYYLSALHASQLGAGDSYLDLKKTISIHILAFNLFAGDRFRRAFSLCDEETGERLCEDLRLVYLEVPKYVRQGTPRNRLEYWLMYLAGMEAKKMPEAMVKDPMIGEALNLEKLFLQSREWTDTNLRLKGKKGPPARGAAPKGLGGVEPEKQPLRFADANHLPFQGRQSILNANWYYAWGRCKRNDEG